MMASPVTSGFPPRPGGSAPTNSQHWRPSADGSASLPGPAAKASVSTTGCSSTPAPTPTSCWSAAQSANQPSWPTTSSTPVPRSRWPNWSGSPDPAGPQRNQTTLGPLHPTITPPNTHRPLVPLATTPPNPRPSMPLPATTPQTSQDAAVVLSLERFAVACIGEPLRFGMPSRIVPVIPAVRFPIGRGSGRRRFSL